LFYRFIGELFKLGMLTTNIMQRCIKDLLNAADEESLECLCKLLTTIGKDLENKNQVCCCFSDKIILLFSHKLHNIWLNPAGCPFLYLVSALWVLIDRVCVCEKCDALSSLCTPFYFLTRERYMIKCMIFTYCVQMEVQP
jgi:hypothetical protein